MPNRLAHETSPYLLQHAGNPVDWYAWGPEALERAKCEETPIFLSIGYSACHWCHVMAHESFENDRIAGLLNTNFVNIKVDREERPDLDQVYMNAVQMMTGHGGWPMSVFLTPELKPFFGGTYWPPEPRMNMPGFTQVIEAVGDAWRNRRPDALQMADQITGRLQQIAALSGSGGEITPAALKHAEAALERIFDHRHGGFGGAPKFPHPIDLRLLLCLWHREPRKPLLDMVTLTLDKMAAGGIYDHLGGGFHRYSVDERWLVPHFEKMLYDNALLAGAYLDGFQATGNVDYATVARETLDYVLREMTGEQGGFYSTQDADSEGEEGKFYVWTPGEIERLLEADTAQTFCYVYDVSEEGNFEGQNILNRPKSWAQAASILNRDESQLRGELTAARQRLLDARGGRVRPGLDDKVLVSWNGLMIESMARAGGILDEPVFTAAAGRAAEFLLGELRRDDGRLWHCWRGGRARFDAYLDDYTCLADALVTLYETTFDERWIEESIGLTEIVLHHFADPQGGGFFYTADDHEPLIARQKDAQDSSVPSGNAMAATALLRLGKLTGRRDLLDAAEATLSSFAALLTESAGVLGQMTLALDFHLGPTCELVFAGELQRPDVAKCIGDFRRRYLPRSVVALAPPDRAAGSNRTSAALDELLADKLPQTDGGPALYVCRDFTCEQPAPGEEAIATALERLAVGKL